MFPAALLVIQGKPHPTGEGTEEYYRYCCEWDLSTSLDG